MLIAGIIGNEGKLQTASIINSIFTSKGKKVSIVDTASVQELNSKRLKEYVSELEKNNIDVLLVKSGLPDIGKLTLCELKFDMLIYTDRAEGTAVQDMNEYSGMLRDIFAKMSDGGVIIVNVDDIGLIRLLQGMKYRFITYGFNTKASITTSSIGDTVDKDGFICCLQRSISTKDGRVIEPQEYKFNMKAGEFDSHSVLAAASFAIVNGIDLNGTVKLQ